ncbi:MAG: Crp/Fnr family transcriptional regulator [Bacteroidota bacterium]
MISPNVLGFYPLFSGQSPEMLMKIASLADERKVDAGYQLFFEGEVAKALFLVREGAVVLTVKMGDNTGELEPLGKGEVVGWSSVVRPNLYKFGAYTNQKSDLLEFNGEKLRNLFDENPGFGYYFMQELAEVIGDRLVSKCVQLTSLFG